MTTLGREKRRARRIAADEAHAWARNLQLNNPLGKLVLCMLTLYVNGDGVCYVGIGELAKDCELSQNTIRSRLDFLEGVGAIVRHPQWIDERGRRNGDGHGKRTTDDIKLLIDADIDVESDAAAAPISPSPREGLTSRETTVSPSVALQQPFTSVQGLISEPEPESPLKAPQGAERERSLGSDEKEPEHFGPAWEAWPGHQAMRRDLALDEFRSLSPDQQRLCRAAIPQYLQLRKQIGRNTIPDFHRWIRVRGFDEFPTATLDAAPAGTSSSYDAAGSEARALKALYGFARVSLFEHRGRVVYPLPVTAQVLKFGEEEFPARNAWHWIDEGARGQLAAWSAFLAAHVHVARPALLTTRVDGEATLRGFWAPWPWPPRKDGSISPVGEGSEGEA